MTKQHKVSEIYPQILLYLILYLLPNLLLLVLAGLFNTLSGLFCGFLIAEQNFPTFWLFMYWLNNLHYNLEGLIMSQFKDDTTPIKTLNGEVMTAEDYMTTEQFSTWSYGHIGYDVLGLGVYIAVAM